MRTRLELENGVSLGLKDEIAIPLTFSIADIREPDKRNSNHSKTIEIPRSKEADGFFKSAFEIDGYDNYNPNLKKKCTLFIDDFPQIIGFIQLLKINVEDENNITYEVSIKGNVANLFTEWADKLVTDIDFSDLDHDYIKSVQKASWTAPIGIGYVYPMIDYGYTNAHEFNVKHFFPAIYLKEFIDRFFALIGFTYESEFFNTDFFKRLIIPSPNIENKLTAEQRQQRSFRAEVDGDYTTDWSAITGVNNYIDGIWHYRTITLPFDLEVYDFTNQYDNTTFIYTNLEAGQYAFKSNVSLNSVFSGTLDTGGDRIECTYNIKLNRGGVITTLASSWDILYFPTFNGTSDNLNFYLETPTMDFLSSDIVYCELSFNLFLNRQLDDFGNPVYSQNNKTDYNFNILDGGIFLNDVSEQILIDGNVLGVNNVLPQKTKIKDVFKWVVQMFNLYITTDNENEKNVFIEPRESFYTNGITIDWTDKLSIDKQLTIEPIGSLDAVRYEYVYKIDSDYWNKKYFDAYNEVFGSEIKTIENDFLKNTKKNEIGFSPTPMAQIDGTDRVIPQIVSVESTESGNTIKPLKKTNIRVLYYGGVLSTTNNWSYTSVIEGDTSENTYAYAGHLDSITTPTLDLSFGVPREVYYNATTYTNNNLFNRFHKKFLEEITDKDSKIVTCYLSLNAYDIATLDFRNQFYIDGHLLRLNKIMDYNPIANQLTKCEFIKIKDATPFIPSSISVNVVLDQSPF